ncbi:MAG: group I intron-associated PD-(D/E)XK endonuclease [Candidatus Sulfotelmatobacter sp.]
MDWLMGDIWAVADPEFAGAEDGEGKKGHGYSGGRMGLPPKRRGELAELAFVWKAMRLGYMVSKPWGDSDRYDFIVDAKGWLSRVQVRSTECRLGPRGYAVHASVYVGEKIVGLTADDIDVLVAYIVPLDVWYVVPVKAFAPRKNLWFYPEGSKKGSMFEEFREAWGVMEGEE